MMEWCCCCRKKSNNKVDDDTDASEPLIKTADGYGDSDDSVDGDQPARPPMEKQRTIGEIVDVSERTVSDMDGVPELTKLGRNDTIGSVDIADLLEEQEQSLNTEGVVSKLEKPKVRNTIPLDKVPEENTAN
jgi:hypothetical protein